MKYSWDDEEQVYRDEEGHAVRDAALMALLSLLIGKVSKRLVDLNDRMRVEEGDRRAIQTHLGLELGLAHRMMAALAAGGLRNMSEASRTVADRRISSEITYLVRFFAEGPYISDAKAEQRISRYADATYATYQQSAMQSYRESGYNEVRRVLDEGAEHCADCPILAERDWVPVDELVQIGDSECGSSCRCSLEFRKPEAAQEAA